ncbi:MAG: SIR2 family protein [Carboxylicivirga sp.]|jgi:hypothetical protein|nr:SIR2 family protein [Carboxylicivirga sp.]
MNKVLLIGNDINNINNSTSWEDLLKRIVKISGNNINVSTEKPFPLLYEEIYLKALKSSNIDEDELKSQIADIIGEIEPNEIHDALLNLDVKDYVTTNYDYVLQKRLLGNQKTDILKNKGVIRETKYSVYRHNRIEDKRFWHVHGEINVPKSITLGFEHYGGQLQQFRNYTVSGTSYKSKKTSPLSLHKRLKENIVTNESWIDFFFKDEIHILGLKLGYVETDLWWLLTNRARFQLEKLSQHNSRIIYYCPEKYKDEHKTSIMEANNIEVKFIKLEGKKFYKESIKMIKNGL